MLNLLPEELPAAQPLPAVYPAQGVRRARVALLAGCVQQVLAPEINWATLRVLARNGVEVVIPPAQGCCGALSMHIGEAAQARTLARNNLGVFPPTMWMPSSPMPRAAARACMSIRCSSRTICATVAAQEFAAKVQDISVFLAELGLITPPPLPAPLTVAYHDACHLAHAQGVTAPPRQLLTAIPNVTLVEIAEGELCCGSAGTYNLEQPNLAGEIGERKARNILATGAQAVVTGNIGCMTQIEQHLAALGEPLPVYHTVQILDQAYVGQRMNSLHQATARVAPTHGDFGLTVGKVRRRHV